jgi:hypothetical protein
MTAERALWSTTIHSVSCRGMQAALQAYGNPAFAVEKKRGPKAPFRFFSERMSNQKL